MLEEKRNSTVLRQFWFVDVENTLPAIMVERVLCIYWDYSSISIFSSDLSSTVKWSSQTMIRSSHRFTRASPKASKRAGGCLMKVLQLVDAGNLCVSGSSIDRTFFSLFPEFEDLVGNLVVKVLQEVNQHKLTIQLRLLKIINDTASLNNSSVVSNCLLYTSPSPRDA